MRPIDADVIAKYFADLATEKDDGFGGTSRMIAVKISHIIQTIDEAPTIELSRPSGEWVDKGWKGDWQFETDGRGNCWYEYECSECGFRNKGNKSNFCPNCGAKMSKRGE